MEEENCPFCRNPLNSGATACGHCGAFMAVSQLSSFRRLACLAWLVIGLFVIFISQKYFAGILISGASLIGVLLKPRVNWVKQ
jgi:hypothetical protein